MSGHYEKNANWQGYTNNDAIMAMYVYLGFHSNPTLKYFVD